MRQIPRIHEELEAKLMRRKLRISTPKTPEKRTAFGDFFVEMQNRLDALLTQAVLVREPWTVPVEVLICELFDPKALDIIHEAKLITACAVPGTYEYYSIQKGATLNIHNWDSTPWLPPHKGCLRRDTDMFRSLCRWTENVNLIRQEFAVVRHVLEWCNDNLTSGAVRHYWPAAKALLPKHVTVIPDKVGNFKDNPQIASMLPAIRMAAGVMAGAALLPDTPDLKPTYEVAFDVTKMWLPHPQGTTEIDVNRKVITLG